MKHHIFKFYRPTKALQQLRFGWRIAAEGICKFIPQIVLRTVALSIVILAVVYALLAPTSARAQAQFQCTGDIYQVQSGQLRIFDTATATYTNIGPSNPSYNSLGFNTQDNLLYATRDNGIVRIDANGTMTALFDIGFNTFVGDLDDANNMYLRRDATTLTRINLISQQQTNITLSTKLVSGAADWAFVATPSGERLIAPGRTQLSLINPETGQNNVSTIANYPNEGSAGATWSDINGRIFTFRNTTGNVYEILDYLTANPRAVLVAVGVPSGSNDGSSCRKRPFPNFPPIAFDDAFKTPFQTALTGANIIADNGNGQDNDPDGTPVTVSSSLISLPDNGIVSYNIDGSFTYTPDVGFAGVDQFTYEIADATGLTAQAIVTITVTRARVNVTKGSNLYTEAANMLFHLPGNDVVYHLTIANSGNQEVDNGTLFIVDRWPANLRFLNGDLDTGGAINFADADSVVWQDNGSGLDFDFARDVRFSDGSGEPSALNQCDYTPNDGYDPNVRYICIQPKGELQPAGSATFYMRGKIE